MITVAIIAILAAIAIPNYNQYVMRGRLTDAFSSLSTLQLKLENYFQDNRVYGTAGACAVNVATSNSQYFTYSCATSNSDQNFVITATGRNATDGFVFTINDAGAKATTAVPAGWAGAGNTCWVSRTSGACS